MCPRIPRSCTTSIRRTALPRRGRISRSKIREITRVATVDTEDFWLDATAHHNTRQIEMMVARCHKGRKPGEPGGDKGKARPVKTRVTLDFEPDQMTILREAVERVCKMAGETVRLADAIGLMAQEFLHTAYTENDVGNRYRLVIHADPTSKLAWVNSPRGTSRESDETLAQTLCDAEELDLRKAEGETCGEADGSDGSDDRDACGWDSRFKGRGLTLPERSFWSTCRSRLWQSGTCRSRLWRSGASKTCAVRTEEGGCTESGPGDERMYRVRAR